MIYLQYSVAQIFLSVLSMVICIQKQPCGKFNCVAALVLYGVLLTYQIFVAVMVVKIASIPIVGDGERHGNGNWLEEFEAQNTGAGSASNSIFEDHNNIKEYSDVIIAVEQPDGEKYAIARLLKDVAIISPILCIDEESSHSKEDKNTPFKEKTRCESAQENLPSSCNNHNRLEKSEVSASKLEDLHSDNMGPKIASEITSRAPICNHLPMNEKQSGVNAQGLEMVEHELIKAGTKQEDEELASDVFLATLSAEIVSFFENNVSRYARAS
ncbi:hypothetical protein GOP47_0021783 [Adiantum capillus-veneris]|uniref:Uncharacterized protein n=1 Tax=Adiantum capillus-veneris TaxID=13818 RepID=A0A9D4Z863_ADICA|nr:hypothetical protein GOP47_0021783 [Adiantum capillus-veneris]